MMLEIIMSLVVLLGLAKRKGHGRRRPNWQRYLSGNIEIDLAMTSLGPKAVVSQLTQLVVDTMRVSSVECTYTIQGLTPGDNIGPFLCGVAHGDYSGAEVEAWIEAAAGWDFGDMIAKEVRGRRIRQIGVLNSPATLEESSRLNDGKVLRTKLNWALAEGDGLRFWIYNLGTSAVATTAPNYTVFGKANLWQM